jgi:pyruvate/2-oxoglutarate dehydrogenase complex dihydrolipoamide dehydrogenase (E3) component
VPTHTTDIVVIGAGPAGENVADYAVQNGLTAAIVESELVGGECSYWACMPSKALLRPTEVLAAVRRVPAAAAALRDDAGVDVDAVLRLRDSFASGWDDQGQVDWLEGAGIELHRGHGRLAGERRVEVTAEDGTVTTLVANRAVVVATGSGAARPPIEGLREVRTWDNRDITSAKEVPSRLLVLGGGVVGVEMAQAWRRLGAEEVTVVEAEDRILPGHEPVASSDLAAALEAEGVRLLTGARMTAVRRDGSDGPVTATLEDGTEIVGDELLVAVGRRPLTDDLGLDTVGLADLAGRWLTTDGRLRVEGVEGDWLYAVGDVNGRALVTHNGKYQARLLGDHLAGRQVDDAWADERAVPGVVFTDPQVASVGLTEAAARDAGLDVVTVSHDVGHVAGGALMGRGFGGTALLVVAQQRRVVVGATFVGPGVGELLHAATIAIVGQVPLDTLWHAVPAFPSVSEVWLRLLEAYRREHGPLPS